MKNIEQEKAQEKAQAQAPVAPVEKAPVEKVRKTYNEQLDEQGTTKFLLRRSVNQEKHKIGACFVFVPNIEKAQSFVRMLNAPTPAAKIAGRFVCVRNNNIVLALDIESGACSVADFSTQTKRGKRNHEKLKEGVVAYMNDFHKGVAVDFSTDNDFVPMLDNYQSTGGQPLDIDDLLALAQDEQESTEQDDNA